MRLRLQVSARVFCDPQSSELKGRRHGPGGNLGNAITAESLETLSQLEQLAWVKHGLHVRIAGLVLVRQRPGSARP